MKKLALVFPLLIMSACAKAPLTTNGTPAATQGLPACDGRYFPMVKKGSSSCAPNGASHPLEGAQMWHAIGQNGGLAHRYIGPACTNKTVPVGDNPFPNGMPTMVLQFGPCGAAIDPNEPLDLMNGTDAKVFLPSSGHGYGYQVTKPDNTTAFTPEAYSSQLLYPPVAPTCPYTLCFGPPKSLDHPRPGVKVTLNIPAGSTLGRVRSDPPGITLSGADEASGLFSGDVTLIAEPTGSHVRAVFSGDCKKPGDYGQRAACIVKLAPDPKVKVTFECEKGFTCGRGSKD